MALDESKENDEIFEDRGVTYLVEKELFERIKPIAVEFIHSPRGGGFKLVSSLKPPENACGSCTSC